MVRRIKGFVACDSFINNQPGAVSSLYEISPISLTYTKERQEYYSTEDTTYTLHVFSKEETEGLQQPEVNRVVRVVKDFVIFASTRRGMSQQNLLVAFMAQYNGEHGGEPVHDLTIGTLIDSGDAVGSDYLHFTVQDLECDIWLNDLSFRAFYPDYEIDIVFPFEEFSSQVSSPTQMIAQLQAFDLVEFNARTERVKAERPTTHVKVLNIPYHVPASGVQRNCYFAFNQYGSQGNYDYVLKLKLYEYLLSLGLSSEYIEQIFPSILKINEFFITPRWDKMAIASHVGQTGIHSQISRAYEEEFDLTHFVKVYPQVEYLRENTYHVPYDYNNVLLAISNGFYSEEDKRDFRTLYSDLITVTSTHPDFARMRAKTQRFCTLLESLLRVADAPTSSKMFAAMVATRTYTFGIVSRQGVHYLTYFFEGHQYYVLPRYEFFKHQPQTP